MEIYSNYQRVTIEQGWPKYPQEWEYFGEGSHGSVYVFGDRAFKIIPYDPDHYQDALSLRGHNHRNVVAIYEVYLVGESEYIVIEMERLCALDLRAEDNDQVWQLQNRLCDIADRLGEIPALIKEFDDPEVIRMLNDIYAAGQQLNVAYMDVHMGNIMYDPKNDVYKQIDVI
jgi:hypothetical protein